MMKSGIRFLFFSAFLLVLTACDSVLYYPSHDQIYDPTHFGVTPEDVWIQTEDALSIHGWYFQHAEREKAPRGVFVFFHGNGGNISSHFPGLLWSLAQGFDFFIFDYEGYGQSPGSPSPRATVMDGKAAVRYAHGRNPDTPLIIFGQSLGGAVALRTVIELKEEVPIKLVVADSTFSSYREVARHIVDRIGLGGILAFLLPSDDWAPGDRVTEISPTPLLVVHGDADTVVDYIFGQQLFEISKDPKEFWSVPLGKHTDAFTKHDGFYQKALLQKLKEMNI